MLKIETREDLQRLVDEGIEESLTLDYKASPALARDSEKISELCKDVSAFANSAGGQIVYGIEEDKATKKPVRIDEGVVDAKITREWIEQTLNSRIQPRMDGVRINRIEISSGRFGYVISVPQGRSGAHQAPDHKYYKRFELQSVPMHDYEIRDIGRRSSTPALSVALRFVNTGSPRVARLTGSSTGPTHLVRIEFAVSNSSHQPAEYAALIAHVDSGLTLNDIGKFQSISPQIAVDGRMCNVLATNLGLPASSPLFQENEEIAGSISIRVPSINLLKTFYIACHIRTPGYTKYQRWDVYAMGQQLTIDEVVETAN